MNNAIESLTHQTPRILIASFIVALLGYSIAAKIPVSYDVHLSYVVSQEGREDTPGFRYDGYYALSATDLFAATLAAWIAQPQTIARAYKAADVSLPTYDAIDLGKHIRSEKAAPGLVNVTIRDSSQNIAESVTRGVANIVPAFIAQQNTTGTPAVTFRGIASDSWTGVSRIAPLPIALVVFMFALFVQILWTLFFR